MADGYDRDREGVEPHIRGRIFELGVALFFRDRENGYVRQSRIYESSEGRIRFDHIKIEQGRTYTIEDKSGRIEGRKDEKQLKALREILAKDPRHSHLLRSVEGEAVSKEVRTLIDGLARDFPTQFAHQVISRADAREIWARGRALEKGQQLELPGVGELARQSRDVGRNAEKRKGVQQALAFARSLAVAKQQARTQQALAQAVETKNQQLDQAQKSALVVDAADVQQAHHAASQQLDKVRSAEKANTKDMLAAIGVTGEHARAMEEILAQGRENQRQRLVQGIEAVGKVAAREARAQLARQQAAEFQRRQRELARQRGYAPELQAIMELMNQGRPAPGVSLPGAPDEVPEVQRGGRAAERALELRKQQGLGIEKAG
ncbi:hypothetical protein ACFYTQ_22755 [Nocardia sp. NPDC004068]|uniref:hypothetical protein n=1 Tax=Nocardia sp. NPDC004068 TaxID=3364303 RepID=UPI0036ACA52F